MFRFHHVLFPVDFSSGCQALAPTVRRMVEVGSADVTLLHAIDEELWLGRRHELERLMRQMKAIAGDGPRARFFDFRLERGQPAVRILEHVRAHPIDLVVIPAGGTSRPVGSVTDRLLAEASSGLARLGRGALPCDDRHGCQKGLLRTRTRRV